MKTRTIPAIVMLAAGLITCIAGIATHMETVRFVKILLAVLVVFYVIGCIAKLIIDSNFKEMQEDTTDGSEASEEEEADGEEEQELEEPKEEKAEK